jgi:predicted transcriptional regulator
MIHHGGFMQVKEVMCKDFKIIQPDTTLREAAEYMRQRDCGYLPVGKDDRLTGAVTDRDIIVRGIAPGHNPDDTMVKDIMTEKVVYCFEEEDLKEAAKRMKEQQIRRLIVLNSAKRMTGVITVGDIARASNDNMLTGEIEVEVAKVA